VVCNLVQYDATHFGAPLRIGAVVPLKRASVKMVILSGNTPQQAPPRLARGTPR